MHRLSLTLFFFFFEKFSEYIKSCLKFTNKTEYYHNTLLLSALFIRSKTGTIYFYYWYTYI